MLSPEALEAVFNPHRVAVVGASDAEGKLGTVLMRNLSTFPGEGGPGGGPTGP